LQRTAGNAAVNALLRSGASPTTVPSGPVTVQRLVSGAAKTNTMTKYDANRTALANALIAGAAQTADQRLRNSCQWIQQGKAKLFPLTPTHDRKKRATALGSPGERARFPRATGDVGSGALTTGNAYNWDDRLDRTNIDVDETSTGGWRIGGDPSDIAIVDASSKSRSAIFEVLKHEVQHDADLHDQIAESTGESAGFTQYRTEFNAYSLQGEGTFNPPGAGPVVQMGHTWRNQRHFDIFKHIYDGYDKVRNAWDAEAGLLVANRAFQNKVVAYGVESPNRDNSPRVDDFLKHVLSMKRDKKAKLLGLKGAKVRRLGELLDVLTKEDAFELSRNIAAGDIMRAHLSTKVFDTISFALKWKGKA
jgi:hypothetical protein